MSLKLSLSKDRFLWALVHPLGKNFIKPSVEPGYQEVNLILSQSNPGPIAIDLEDYPDWARKQIVTAVKGGQLLNTGDKLEAPVKTVSEPVEAVVEVIEAAQPATKKRRSRKKQSA
jgi:hypothetical protein